MKYFLSLFFFLSTLVSSTAQNDTLADKSYKELSGIINKYILRDTAVALSASKIYLKKAQEEKDVEQNYLGLEAFAIVYSQANDHDKAIRASERLLSFTEENELTKYYSRTYQMAGMTYIKAGTFSRGLRLFENSLAIAERNEDINSIQIATYFISLFQAIEGNYISAINSQHRMIKRIEGFNDLPKKQKQHLVLLAENSIGDTFLKAKNGDSAYHYINKNLQQVLKNKKDSCMIRTLYVQLGHAEILKKKYDEAKKSLDYSMRYCRPLTKFDSMIVGGYYAKVYAGKKDFKKTISYLEDGFSTYEVSDKEEGFMDDFYLVLANAYKEEKNLEKASYYYQKHVHSIKEFAKIKDTLNSSFRNKELREFENELQALKEEKDEKQNTLNYFLLGGSLIILTLLFFLLKFYRDKKSNEAKFEALLKKIERAEKPENIIDTKDQILEESNTTDIPEETKQQILEGLKKLENKEYFLKQECNSYNVAKKINTNTSYLSKVVNAHFGKNFNTYINDLRINYAIVRLKDDVIFRSYSIQSIAEELGYKSADSFTKYFKKDTGLNPSFYIKEIKNIA
ncbi:helix-turn-helix domain-containing protein [Cochleicola gelatinilyticus]|uniref:HTH araC/xylS-type domain-containing protein n=1 Tax=Cochleicola gelatinilyticus TaxID=1763537 RepID=A0A167IYW2_9FLAO|nr:helix-turn-helix domain-containing protein [Cochleicola gelatinilyticus]OAB80150.1 hypothetical protein ULVI_05275 [Cochleicola gelatinilyticus]